MAKITGNTPGDSDAMEGSVVGDRKTSVRTPLIETLESRIMYSADIIGLPVLDSDLGPADDEGDSPLALTTPVTAHDNLLTGSKLSRYEVVFVDTSIPEADEILDDLTKQQNAGRALQIVSIAATDNGVEKITGTLAPLINISAVHIISHGTSAGIALGDIWLDRNTAESYASDFAQWLNALTDDADLMLYGCNLAASTEGIELLVYLGEQSGTDVAASQNTTGHVLGRGDWELEYSTGAIDTEIALSEILQDNWNNQLAIDLLAIDDDFGNQLSGDTFSINDVTTPATNILANDFTSAPSAIELLSVTAPAIGTITNNNNEFTYHSTAGDTGEDSFDYTITDSTQPIQHHFPLDSNDIVDATNRIEVLSTASDHPTLVGDSLDFDGDDFIEIPDIEYADAFTISFDFKVGDLANGAQQLFQHGYWRNDNSINVWINYNKLAFGLLDSLGDSKENQYADVDLLPNSNHNLTITHKQDLDDGSTEKPGFRVYLDNVELEIYNGNQQGGDSFNPPTNIYIGQYDYSWKKPGHYLDDHQIKNLRIYNEIVSPLNTAGVIDYSTGTVSLNLKDPNSAPVFSLLDETPTYVENQAPIALDIGATIFDAELSGADNFDGSTLTLQRDGGANSDDLFSSGAPLAELQSGPLTYNDPDTGGIEIGTILQNSEGTLVLNFNSAATNDLVNKTLQSIHYSNSSETPPASAIIKWTFNDGFSDNPTIGSALSTTASTLVEIKQTNQAPELTLHNAAPTWVENSTPVLIDANATIFDTELSGADNFDGSTLTLQRADGPVADDVFTGTDSLSLLQPGPLSHTDSISGTIEIGTILQNNSGILKLAFNAAATNDLVNSTLQSIQYSNISGSPPSSANIEWIFNDGFSGDPILGSALSATGYTDIQIEKPNQAPEFAGLDATPVYVETQAPVLLDTDATIFDRELSETDNFDGSTLTLQRAGGPVSDDRFSGADSLQPLETGPLTYTNSIGGQIDIGTVLQNSSGSLSLTFNSAATNDIVNEVLQSIQYSNSSAAPQLSVDIEWTFSDGFSGDPIFGSALSTTGVTSVQIKEPNQSPEFNQLDASPVYIENEAPIILDTDVTVFDTELTGADNFDGAMLTLHRSGGTASEDIFSATGIPGPLQIGPLHYNDQSNGSIEIGSVLQNNEGTLKLTFNSNATNDLVNKSLQSIQYSNSSDTPPSTVDIQWTFKDGFSGDSILGTELSTTANTIIQIERVADIEIELPETITLNEDAPYAFSDGLLATGHDLNQSIVMSTSLEVTNGTLSVNTSPGLVVTTNSTNTALILNGSSAVINDALNTLIYLPQPDFHGNDTLTVTASVDSSTKSVSVNMLVSSVNDKPTLVNAGNTALFNTSNATPVQIDSDIRIVDPEAQISGTFNNTTLTLSRFDSTDYVPSPSPKDSANPYDVFTSTWFSGNTVDDGGVNFGLVNTNSDGLLEITFNEQATKARIDSLIQSIHYNNPSSWPPTNLNWPHDSVDLQWTFTDIGADNNGIPDNSASKSASALSTIDINTSDDQPIRVANKELRIAVGVGPQAIDTQFLNYVDLQTPDSELIYEITYISPTALITRQDLTTDAQEHTQLTVGDSFSQADINSGLVKVTSTATTKIIDEISFTVSGNSASDNDVFYISVVDDGPSDLQPGIRLNMDGGDKAYLNSNESNFAIGKKQLTWEFIFSQLQANNNGQASTLYSTSDWFGNNYENLSIRPDPNGNTDDGIIEWNSGRFDTSGPSLSAPISNIFNGEVHSVTLAVDMDNGNNGDMNLYVDGVLLATNVHGVDDTAVSGSNWVIGRQFHPSIPIIDQGNHFSGVFHNVRIWDTIRTGTDINESRFARLTNDPIARPDLIIDWQMNDSNTSEATTVEDTATTTPSPGLSLYPAPDPVPTNELRIDETAAVGSVVGFMMPMDPEPDAEGYLYSIVPDGQNPVPFSIDATTGKITVSDILSQTATYYDVNIRVESTENGATVVEKTRIWINLINEAPVILSNNPTLAITENDLPAVLDPGIRIIDNELDAASYQGASVTLQRYDDGSNSVNPQPQDTFTSDLFTSTKYTVNQTNGELQITFNEGTSSNDVNLLLQSVRYQNTSDLPDENVRLQWLFDDGNTGAQGSGEPLQAINYSDVVIRSVNDIPIANSFAFNSLEGDTHTFTADDFSFADPVESHNMLAIKIESIPVDGTLYLDGVALTAASVTAPVSVSKTALDNGQLEYRPPLNADGNVDTDFSFSVQDDGGTEYGGSDTSVSHAVNITINGVNDPPVGSDNIVSTPENSPLVAANASTYTFSSSDFPFVDTEEQHSLLGVVIDTLPAYGLLQLNGSSVAAGVNISAADIDAGHLTYLPDPHTHGTDSFIFSVQDDGGTLNGGVDTSLNPATLFIDVLAVNDQPSAVSFAFNMLEGDTRTFTAADFSFADPVESHSMLAVRIESIPGFGTLYLDGVALTAASVTAPVSVSKAALDDGHLEYRPPLNADGNVDTDFSFSVQDDGGTNYGGIDTSVSHAVNITINGVNDPPVASDNIVSTLENSPLVASNASTYTFSVSDFPFVDTEEQHRLLGVVIDTLPAYGLLQLNGNTIVAGVNISAADIDAGHLTYLPDPHTHGTDSFIFSVQDDGGTLNDGIDTSLNPATLFIDVLAVNDQPSAGSFAFNSLEGDTRTFTADDFSFADPVESHSMLAVRIESIPGFGTLYLGGIPVTTAPVTVSKAALDNGHLEYRPPLNADGNVDTDFSFSVQDDGGTNYGGIDTSVSHAVNITINGVNDPPVASDNIVSTLENSPLVASNASTYTFSVSDFPFVDTEEQHRLLGVVIDTLPAYGLLQLNGNTIVAGVNISAADIAQGHLTYRPDPHTHGTDSFIFSVQDDGGTLNGGVDTSLNPATLFIDVLAVNDQPSAVSFAFNSLEGDTHTFTADDFSFADPVESHNMLAVRIESIPAVGTLYLDGVALTAASMTAPVSVSKTALDNGQLVYRPPLNTDGNVDTDFSFSVQDDGGTEYGGSDTSVSHAVNITINGVNDPPAGSDSTVSTIRNTALNLGLPDFGFSDIDGHSFQSVIIKSLPGSGSLSLAGSPVIVDMSIASTEINSGRLVYTPAADSTAADSFTFLVRDNGGNQNNGSDTALNTNTLSISVFPNNTAPTGSNSSIAVTEDRPYQFRQPDFPFIDLTGNSLLEIIIQSATGKGKLQLNGNTLTTGSVITAAEINEGGFRYIPAENNYGLSQDHFSYYLRDNGGIANNGSDTSVSAYKINIDITAVKDRPQGTDKTISTTEDTPLKLQRADFGFSDADNDSVVGILFTQLPANGLLTHNGVALNEDSTVPIIDIDAGLVEYVPDTDRYGPNLSAFYFQVIDSGLDKHTNIDDSPNVISINVAATNDQPVAGSIEQYTIIQNQEFQLPLPANLFTDPDPDDPLQITAAGLPEWMTLNAANNTLNGVALESGTFVIRLIATDPQDASAHQDLFFTVEPIIAAAQQNTTAQTDTAAPSGLAESRSRIFAESTMLANANTLTARPAIETSEENITAPEAVYTRLEIPEFAALESLPVLQIPEQRHTNSREFAMKSTEVVQLDNVGSVLPLEQLLDATGELFTTSKAELTKNMNGNSEFISQSQNGELKVTSVTAGVSAGLSIGYIMWLLRSGLLLSSVISALPAWRTLDPLPVLSNLDDNQDNKNDKSLEDMVDHSNAEPHRPGGHAMTQADARPHLHKNKSG